MMFKSLLTAVALASVVISNPAIRQTTNTNTQINQIVDSLSESAHIFVPNIVTLQASHQTNTANLSLEITQLADAFDAVTTDLSNTAVSSGDTIDFPTNDDISITFASVLSMTATGLSGLSQAGASNLTAMFTGLDSSIAAATRGLNVTLPGADILVHIMMLDARQFFADEGMNATLAALGF